MKYIFSVVVLVLLGAGCATQLQGPSVTEQNDSGRGDSILPTQEYNVFAANEAKAGKKIAGMVVMSNSGRGISFQGQVTLRGDASFHSKDEAFVGGQICFYPNEEDQNKLPRVAGDNRDVWFCFSNHDEATKLLQPGVTDLTITIDGYAIDTGESEVWNTARLVSVKSK
ncbi:MAG: hypothetical protein WCJ29_04605 [bacterium]